MSGVKKLLTWIFLILVAAIALLAAADNSSPVSLKFLDWETVSLPVAWWMLMAFVVGVTFGTLLNLVSNTRLRMNARRARQVAEGRTRELDQARAEAVQAAE